VFTGSNTDGWGRFVNSGGALYIQAGSLNSGAATAQPIIFTNMYGGSERMRIDSSGNLLVGTTAANGKFTVYSTTSSPAIHCRGTSDARSSATTQASGTSYFDYFTYNGTNVGSITSTGTIALYNTTSDVRLKENIEDADDAASLIDALQVRKFDWKANSHHQRYGFIAQELVEVAPEAVTVPEDPDKMMGVDYSKLVPMLVKELQSLRARVAQLEGN
jgi:hypothetical protein